MLYAGHRELQASEEGELGKLKDFQRSREDQSGAYVIPRKAIASTQVQLAARHARNVERGKMDLLGKGELSRSALRGRLALGSQWAAQNVKFIT